MKIPAIHEHLGQKLAYLCFHGFSGPLGPKGGFGDKIGEGVCSVDPQRTRSYFQGYYLCATFGEN